MPSLTPRIDKIGKNYIINGGMDYWQRAITNTTNLTVNGTTTGYVADRMKFLIQRANTNQNYTIARFTDIPTDLNGMVQYSLRATSNQIHSFTGEDKVVPLFHYVEGVIADGISSTDTVYLSFWFKSSTAGTFPLNVRPVNGAAYQSYTTTFSYTTANTWQQVNMSFLLPGLALAKDNTAAFTIVIAALAGAASTVQAPALNTWYNSLDYYTHTSATNWATNGGYVAVTGIKMNTTGFEDFSRSGGDRARELLLCQRYFEKSYNLNTTPGTVTDSTGWHTMYAYATSLIANALAFKISKRVVPTLTAYGLNGVSGTVHRFGIGDVTVTGINFGSPGENGFDRINSTATPFVVAAGNTYGVHWTSDSDF